MVEEWLLISVGPVFYLLFPGCLGECINPNPKARRTHILEAVGLQDNATEGFLGLFGGPHNKDPTI